MSKYSAVIMQKLALYRELLRVPVESISEHDIELLVLLTHDIDIQAYLEDKRKEQ